MRVRRLLLSLATSSLVAAGPLSAQQVIDQNQPLSQSGFLALDRTSGQTFVQSGENISGVGVFLKSINPAGVTLPVNFYLYSSVPTGMGTPTPLVSGTVSAFLPGNGSGWVDFFFSAIDLTPGTPLFLAVNSGPAGASFQTTDATNPAPYAAGQSYAGGASSSGPYQTLPQYDLAFRTYTTLAVTSTPEPASMALMATGLLGIARVVRRRRA